MRRFRFSGPSTSRTSNVHALTDDGSVPTNGSGTIPFVADGDSRSNSTNDTMSVMPEGDPSTNLLARAGVIEEEDLDPGLQRFLSSRGLVPEDFASEYGLLAPEVSVIIRPYGGEDDDILLQELRPRFVVMYEPNLAFIRRLEVSGRT